MVRTFKENVFGEVPGAMKLISHHPYIIVHPCGFSSLK